MKSLILLGSTGSIGRNVCYLLGKNPGFYNVKGLSAWSNVKMLIKQIELFKPEVVCVKGEREKARIRKKFKEISVLCGVEGLKKMGEMTCDLLFNAVSGFNGMYPTLSALKKGTRIALANKESLVAGGELIEKITGGDFANIIPVDSEHNTLYRLLKGVNREEVRGIVLTASGGPFFNRKVNLENVKVKDALIHPRWKMGKKITVDSATLMNKAMEIVEAGWLFGFTPDNIKVVIHPEAIVHSFVHLKDGSMMAHLYNPDMRIPIASALDLPFNLERGVKPLWPGNKTLSFYNVDFKKFPAIKLGYRVLIEKNGSGCILNAANEEAVQAFLNERIRFTHIVKVVKKVMDEVERKVIKDFADIVTLDNIARERARKYISHLEKK